VLLFFYTNVFSQSASEESDESDDEEEISASSLER